MKNRRVKISQSQLARLVEINVNENTGGVGNLSTDDQPNIGMGSSKLVTKTHTNKPAGRLNIMGGTNPQEFKEGGRKEPRGTSYKKEMTGEHKSSERLGNHNIVVIWPSREAQQSMSGRLEEAGLELPDGWEPGMVCSLCPPPDFGLWINGCPGDEPEMPFDWMNENSHNHVHSDQQDLFAEEEDEDFYESSGIRRQDSDRARRRPYSAKARDRRGSVEHKPAKTRSNYTQAVNGKDRKVNVNPFKNQVHEYHDMDENGEDRVRRQKEEKTMGSGPCICRKYVVGSDGQSTCVKWSPAGCGDAPSKKANDDGKMRCCGNGHCDSGCAGDLCDTVGGTWTCKDKDTNPSVRKKPMDFIKSKNNTRGPKISNRGRKG